MDPPSPEHVNQVAELSKIIMHAFMMAHQLGATDRACRDTALSVFIAIVGMFGSEQETIDALPYVKEALERQMQERLLSETERHDGGTVH